MYIPAPELAVLSTINAKENVGSALFIYKPPPRPSAKFSEIVRLDASIFASSLSPIPPPELFALFCINTTFSIKGDDELFK